MDDIYYERILNRIIQGRLRFKLGDLVLFIEEPSNAIKEASFDIYDDAYNKAYFSGCYVEREALEVLVEYELWTPHVDKKVEELEKRLEELKVEAFQNFFKKRELRGIKRSIKMTQREINTCMLQKQQLDHLTCKGVATLTRNMWMLSQTTKDIDGNLFDFGAGDISVKSVMDIAANNEITVEDMRYIARNSPWRQMWSGSKNREFVFDKRSVDLDKNQLSLVSFSQMYDNVYESPEQPSEDVINDDDCLDGWFIVERRKQDKDKKDRAIDNKLSNSKIANSQEIMLMANNQQEANEIFDLNNDHTRQIIRQRQEEIKNSSGNLNFKELQDVKQDRMMNATNQKVQAYRGMKGK